MGQVAKRKLVRLSTLPLLKAEATTEELIAKMKQYRQGAAAVRRNDGSLAIVTIGEIHAAGGKSSSAGAESVCAGELCRDHSPVRHADFGGMVSDLHGQRQEKGRRPDLKIVGIGKSAVTVLAHAEEHWEDLRKTLSKY